MDAFEKIRTVGKGAYGTAVLYRKKDDDSLVILKEINLHDLSASERNMALNEVNVLAMLDHPNIVSYYDSFEEDGTVIIEMEYADAGTLSQFLSQQLSPLDEKDILRMFHQMVAAMKYVHQHNVLHRDLKTQNIFLTKEGIVKIGDFGISKMISSTNPAASTVLGTPFYISPEMCEGKQYKDKSDIWALGCILYEMACLEKTFQASNLPAVVNKIMRGQFTPIKGNYSLAFRELVNLLLQHSANKRPSAAQLWHDHLPKLMAKHENSTQEQVDSLYNSDKQKFTRSVLYYFDICKLTIVPIRIPQRMKIKYASIGSDHIVVISMDGVVLSWGLNSHGQLGHDDHRIDRVHLPKVVHSLKGKNICSAACGKDFTIFKSFNGILMTCGNGASGCLGHGDTVSCSKPRLIESLLSVDIRVVQCGDNHVFALSREHVYAWGCGKDGKLGLGSTGNQCTPLKVSVPDASVITQVYCGNNCTMLLTEVGCLLACGNNDHNKLGLNQRQGFVMAMRNIFNKIVPNENIFTVVKSLTRYQVRSLSMSNQHTTIIIEPHGHVLTLGANNRGELGTGDTRPIAHVAYELKSLHSRQITKVQSGDGFTLAATQHNELLFWGERPTSATTTTPTAATTTTPTAATPTIAGDTYPPCGSTCLPAPPPPTPPPPLPPPPPTLAPLPPPPPPTLHPDCVPAHSECTLDPSSNCTTRDGDSALSPCNGGGGDGGGGGGGCGPMNTGATCNGGLDHLLEPHIRSGGDRNLVHTESASLHHFEVDTRQSSKVAQSETLSPDVDCRKDANDSLVEDTDDKVKPTNDGSVILDVSTTSELNTDSDYDWLSFGIKDESISSDLTLTPTVIIQMDSSGVHSNTGDTVVLSNIYCKDLQFYILVETTAPPTTAPPTTASSCSGGGASGQAGVTPPSGWVTAAGQPRSPHLQVASAADALKRKSKKRRSFRKRYDSPNQPTSLCRARLQTSASSREGGDEYSSETSELDSRSMVPTWLKLELQDNIHPEHNENTNKEGTSVINDESLIASDTSKQSELCQLRDQLKIVKMEKERVEIKLKNITKQKAIQCHSEPDYHATKEAEKLKSEIEELRLQLKLQKGDNASNASEMKMSKICAIQ